MVTNLNEHGSTSPAVTPQNESTGSDLPQHIGVIGAGVMGIGVAQCFALHGFSVTLVDHSNVVCENVLKTIRQQLRALKLTHPDKIITPLNQALDCIHVTGEMAALNQADYIIENISESLEKKKHIYRQLGDHITKCTTVVANTSAIPIHRLASLYKYPQNVLGIHFMNPVPIKDTVELIVSDKTSRKALAITHNVLKALNKTTIEVADNPGFVSNRILMLTINEAIHTLDDETSSAEGIDTVFTSCFGHPMGPLATADLIGLDVIRDTLLVLQSEYKNSNYSPAKRLETMIEKGKLGRKSGCGFFNY